MSRHTLLLGVDGGGSSTRAWISAADAPDNPLAQAATGPSNALAVGFEAASENVGVAVERALTDAAAALNTDSVALAAACLALAGTGRKEVRNQWLEWCRLQAWWPQHSIVTNDAEAVLAAAPQHQAAIAVIAGTGSLVLGRDAEGRTARTGGLGPVLGDQGSGYAIGWDGVRLAAAIIDQQLDESELVQAAREHFDFQGLDECVAKSANWSRGLVAKFAPAVVDAAETDQAAEKIVLDAAESLATQIRAVERKLRIEQEQEPVTLALAGGMLVHHPAYRQRLLQATGSRRFEVLLVPEPVLGAVRLAGDAAKL